MRLVQQAARLQARLIVQRLALEEQAEALTVFFPVPTLVDQLLLKHSDGEHFQVPLKHGAHGVCVLNRERLGVLCLAAVREMNRHGSVDGKSLAHYRHVLTYSSFHHNETTDQVNGSFQLVALPLFLVSQLLVVVCQAEGLSEGVLVQCLVEALDMRKRQQENLQIIGQQGADCLCCDALELQPALILILEGDDNPRFLDGSNLLGVSYHSAKRQTQTLGLCCDVAHSEHVLVAVKGNDPIHRQNRPSTCKKLKVRSICYGNVEGGDALVQQMAHCIVGAVRNQLDCSIHLYIHSANTVHCQNASVRNDSLENLRYRNWSLIIVETEIWE